MLRAARAARTARRLWQRVGRGSALARGHPWRRQSASAAVAARRSSRIDLRSHVKQHSPRVIARGPVGLCFEDWQSGGLTRAIVSEVVVAPQVQGTADSDCSPQYTAVRCNLFLTKGAGGTGGARDTALFVD